MVILNVQKKVNTYKIIISRDSQSGGISVSNADNSTKIIYFKNVKGIKKNLHVSFSSMC